MAKEVKNYYDILGVKKNASQDDIKKAFKNLAKKHHPDKNMGDKSAEENFKKVNEAYEHLSDPQKRAIYDAGGKNPNQMRSDWFGPDNFNDGFFGRARGFSHFTNQQSRENLDIQLNLNISLEEACFGCKKDITYKRRKSCSTCNGKGTLNPSSIKVCGKCGGHGVVLINHGPLSISTTCPECKGKGEKIEDPCKKCNSGFYLEDQILKDFEIPKGISENNLINVVRMGNFGKNGDCGNLLIGFSYKEHPVFKKNVGKLISREYDVIFECYVPLHISLFGGKIKIPTLHGSFELEIPKNVKNGSFILSKAKGLCKSTPDHEGNIGDQVNIIIVENPKNINDELKKLLLSIPDEEYENYNKNVVTVAREYEKNHRHSI